MRLSDADLHEMNLEEPPRGDGVTSLVLDRSHPLSDLYYRKARYKVYWGGRGSAKSWGFAEALVRLAAALPLRVLCLREYQNSIKESSHKMLAMTITRLGMDSWFTVTNDSIRSRTGAEFIFKGCHNNLNSLRSMFGIDICWLEEAHSISEESWRVIIPTIREDGSEIWVSFNMDDENDATYRRLVARQRPDAIVHMVNYDSNPYFPSVLRAEMEYDRDTDYELYEHVWLGKPKRISKAIVLSGKYVGRDDLDPDGWLEDRGGDGRVRLGMDFGKSDPNALTRSYVQRHLAEINGITRKVRSLFVTHEAYGDVDLGHEFVDFLDSVPGTRRWRIGCDNARPETIRWMQNNGYPNAYAAEKWQGSVEDGIAYLRGFHRIVIDKGRAPNALREAHLWRWKVDPKIVDEYGQPQVLPVLRDRDNHTWDSVRYGHDGDITRGGAAGVWARLAEQPAPVPVPGGFAPAALPDPGRPLEVWERMAEAVFPA